MKCPKCGFNSFEFHDTCKKCGKDLTTFKASHNIRPLVHPRKKEEPQGPLLDATGQTGPAAPGPATPGVPAAVGPPDKVGLATPVEVERSAPTSPPEDFSFDETELGPAPTKVVRQPLSRHAAPEPAPPQGDFSVEDFVPFGELGGGKKPAEEPAPSFPQGGTDSEEIFPSEPHPAAAKEEEPPPSEEGGKKGEKKPGLEWLE